MPKWEAKVPHKISSGKVIRAIKYLVDDHPGEEPGDLEQVDHEDAHAAEHAEGLQGGQGLQKVVLTKWKRGPKEGLFGKNGVLEWKN